MTMTLRYQGYVTNETWYHSRSFPIESGELPKVYLRVGIVDTVYAGSGENAKIERIVEQMDDRFHADHHEHSRKSPQHMIPTILSSGITLHIEQKLHESPHEEKKSGGKNKKDQGINDIGRKTTDEICHTITISKQLC